MKTGKLSKQETYAIKGMWADGHSIKELCEEFDRSRTMIEKALGDMENTNTKELSMGKGPSERTIEKAIGKVKKLLNCGDEKAEEQIKRTLARYPDMPDDSMILANTATTQMSTKDLMKKGSETNKQKDGIAIMTDAASQRSDESKKELKKFKKKYGSRTSRGNIYNIDKEEIE